MDKSLTGGSISSKQRLRADITLLAVAVIWGSGFVAQRVAAREVGPFLFNGMRFLMGAAVLLVINRVRQGKARNKERYRTNSNAGRWSGILLGLLLFAGAAAQQTGLQFTTAGKAGFITGLYVVLVPLFLAIGWRRWPQIPVLIASLLATEGLFLLSTKGHFSLAPGDGLQFLGATFWALHLIVIGTVVNRVDIFRLALVQYLICGVLSTATGLLVESQSIHGLLEVWWAIVYAGAVSVGVAYTLQLVGQRTAPSADAAVILSLEAVFAALFGCLFLSESLSLLQLGGCALMLTGMLIAQPSVRKKVLRTCSNRIGQG